MLSGEKLVSAHAHAHTHKWSTGGRAARPCIKPHIYISTSAETFNRARHTHSYTDTKTHTHTGSHNHGIELSVTVAAREEKTNGFPSF